MRNCDAMRTGKIPVCCRILLEDERKGFLVEVSSFKSRCSRSQAHPWQSRGGVGDVAPRSVTCGGTTSVPLPRDFDTMLGILVQVGKASSYLSETLGPWVFPMSRLGRNADWC
jgi:hypothetical protein